MGILRKIFIAVLFLGCSVLRAQGVNASLTGHFLTNGLDKDVTVSGSTAYVSAYLGGLRIVNVSNPASPQEISS